MTNVMKKISALLLAFAVALTMMPFAALPVNATDDEAATLFSVYVNGVPVDYDVTEDDLETPLDPQIFPFAKGGGKGTPTMNYVVGSGIDFIGLVKEALSTDSLEDLGDAEIWWNNAEGAPQGKFGLPVSKLESATVVFELTDGEGNPVSDFSGADVKTKPIGVQPVQPILATKSHSYPTYTEASDALANGTWQEGASTSFGVLVGGIDSDEYLKKEGTVAAGAFNFVGKFNMTDQPQMNVKMAAPDAVDMTFDSPDADDQTAELNYPLPEDVLDSMTANAVWVSSDEAVATVEEGVVTPVGSGTCTVEAKAKAESEDSIAVFNVTVNVPEETMFSIAINGKDTGKAITNVWMSENKQAPQVFPFAKGGGKGDPVINYVVAEGPYLNAVLADVLDVSALSDYPNAEIWWNNAQGAQQGKFGLPVGKIDEATVVFELADGEGNPVSDFSGTDVKTKPIGVQPVQPIVATKSHAYATYQEASDALADGTWQEGASTSFGVLVGGIDTDEYLKKEGTVVAGAFNFVGKFNITDQPQMNIVLKEEKEESALTFSKAAAQKVALKYSDKEIELLGGVTWASDNEKIAVVAADGKVTPKGIGTCKVTATTGGNEVIAECAVTVKEAAFKPAAPKSFKAVNVKKKSAKLTWKKVSGATGYEVYRSTKKNKGFKKVKTINKAGTVKFVNKKLKKGKTFYFKVKAFKTVNGKKVYSSYTAVKRVKIKK